MAIHHSSPLSLDSKRAIVMNLSAEQKGDLSVALTEATLLGAEVDTERCAVALTLRILTLPPEGEPPEDRRIQFVLRPAGRVAASLRLGRWNDAQAEVVPFEACKLLEIVESFKLPIHGSEFFDRNDDFERWKDPLSLDCRLGDEGMSHSLTLFQEGGDRHLDLRIWFDSLELYDPTRRKLDFADFVSGSKRWWEGFSNGDPRTRGEGIFPF